MKYLLQLPARPLVVQPVTVRLFPFIASCSLFFFSQCLFGLDWLSPSMRSLNPQEFIDKREQGAYDDAFYAMIKYFNGAATFEEYRGAVEAYAKGDFFRSYAAAQELNEIDKIGKDSFESRRNQEIQRISDEADARGITSKEFWALEVLYGEYKIDSGSWLRTVSGFSRNPRHIEYMKVSAAGDILGLTNSVRPSIVYLDQNKPKLRYWRRIYEGVSKQTAEIAKSQEEESEKILRQGKELLSTTQELEDEIERLKREVNRLKN
jgi:hypothetical protein